MNVRRRRAQGRLIEIRYDTSSPRPAGQGQYTLQGTRGAFDSMFAQRMIYLEGRSPVEKWEPIQNYAKEFQHPRWANEPAETPQDIHGGGDRLVIADFIESIRTGLSAIDMIESVTWSCVRPLSADSIKGGGKPVEIPDFSAM